MIKIFAAVLVTCVVLIVVFQIVDPNVESSGTTTTLVDSNSSTDSNTISVTIQGEITRTGTYVLEQNTTLDDLISVASGLTTNADELAFDTTYLLEDKATFYIAPKYDHSDVCSMEPIVKANINEDNEEGLQVVNGIGSTIAKAIVAYRETNGTFGRIEEIKNVSGIGNATFEKIKDYIRLRD